MKIRNGFVSNSSSSSFIIKLNERFPDTIAIAENMLSDKYSEWDHEDVTSATKKNLNTLRKEDDKYIPIYFTSINYDTYIIPLTNDYVFIDTCNNTRWNIADSAITEIPEEVMKKYPDSEGYGGFEMYITKNEVDEDGEGVSVQYNKEFFLVEHGLFLKTPSSYSTCKTCYQPAWVFGTQTVCVRCDHNMIVRGSKIKKIKKSIKL